MRCKRARTLGKSFLPKALTKRCAVPTSQHAWRALLGINAGNVMIVKGDGEKEEEEEEEDEEEREREERPTARAEPAAEG